MVIEWSPLNGNSARTRDDCTPMECSRIQEALSARLDDEAADIEPAVVTTHLAGCAECRSFAAGVTALHRRTRVRAADPVPDLSEAILRNAPRLPAAGAPPESARPPVREWARYALLTLALTQAVIALPALVLGDQSGATVHLARDLGSWDFALAIAWLVVAWAPQRASGLLPFAAGLAVAMSGSAFVNIATGRVHALTESTHVMDLVGLGLLWALARSTPSGRSLLPTRQAPHPSGA